MIKFTLTHSFDCDVATFWQTFLDKAYNDELYKKALGFPEFTVNDQRETEKDVTRRCSGMPKLDVPAPVAKLLGSGFRYVEDGKLDRATNTWTWKLTPSTLADKLFQSGTMRIEAAGEGRCTRKVEIVMEAKVFGLGGLIESATEKQLRDGWEKSATFLTKWLKEGRHKAS